MIEQVNYKKSFLRDFPCSLVPSIAEGTGLTPGKKKKKKSLKISFLDKWSTEM